MGLWGEAEEAPVWASLGDIRVHQVEEVARVGVELLARDGLSPLLVVFSRRGGWGICAAGGAWVPPEVLCGVGRSGRTPWLRCPGLPARWSTSMSPWVFGSRLRAPGDQGESHACWSAVAAAVGVR